MMSEPDGAPLLEPIEGDYVDDNDDVRPETHWLIRGPWKVVAEGEPGIVIAPDHDRGAGEVEVIPTLGEVMDDLGGRI